ncbi:hypothetical protein Pmani_013261 [Petrolisthes manimaculis]|uniref:LisH domain-containing protein n=1 Tax=Petrolisthes manimaculis TaxID=1843537 RepID=A0AAE1PWB8_9EUCA|nr:hypothetical protein Pmani_013261 [Petrolisthes manimaculis]
MEEEKQQQQLPQYLPPSVDSQGREHDAEGPQTSIPPSVDPQGRDVANKLLQEKLMPSSVDPQKQLPPSVDSQGRDVADKLLQKQLPPSVGSQGRDVADKLLQKQLTPSVDSQGNHVADKLPLQEKLMPSSVDSQTLLPPSVDPKRKQYHAEVVTHKPIQQEKFLPPAVDPQGREHVAEGPQTSLPPSVDPQRHDVANSLLQEKLIPSSVDPQKSMPPTVDSQKSMPPSADSRRQERHPTTTTTTMTEVSWDDIGHKLLQEKLLLTALELHTELVEAGCELPRLRDYFSNPGNFEEYAAAPQRTLTNAAAADIHPGGGGVVVGGSARQGGGIMLPRSSSQTTLDSLDWGGLSEDGEGGVDERVAVLEFELRKARQTIQALRANLTQATESKLPAEERKEDNNNPAAAPPQAVPLTSIRPHEQRTLNFLVNEYLVNNSYKLTAITFADENDDQDFEHWDDVGLNTSRPPNLVHLLRDTGHSRPPLATTASQTIPSHTHTPPYKDNNNSITDSPHEPPLKDTNNPFTDSLRTPPYKDTNPFSESIQPHTDSIQPPPPPHTQPSLTDSTQMAELERQLTQAKRKITAQERELEKLRRRTSTPCVTPLPSPGKPQVALGRSQAEGHPTPALVLSPTVDSQSGDGRGSPEGTSDTEDVVVAGGGFVLVAPGPVRGHTVGSTARDQGQEQHGTTTTATTTAPQTRDQDHSGVESGKTTDLSPTLSGFQDPSESIEVLLETGNGDLETGDLGTGVRDLETGMGDLELDETGREVETKAGETETSISEDRQTLDSQDATIGDQSTVTEGGGVGSGPVVAGGVRRQDTGLAGSPVGSKGRQDMEAEYARQLRNEAKILLKASSTRQPPEAFLDAVINGSVGVSVVGVGEVEAAVRAVEEGGKGLVGVVADSLHNIAPNVILAKREVVVPLVVCGVMLHRDPSQREKLLHLLFNLIKRPDAGQRGTILAGLAGLGRVLGPGGVEGEILPQCWEQLSHKYVERRLLVAESTAALAPFAAPALRNSLLLSMLLQLLAPGGERDPGVRGAALASLALLVTFLDDQDKLAGLANTLVHCVEATDVTQTVPFSMVPLRPVELLVDALGTWALEVNALPALLDPLLTRLVQLGTQSNQLPAQQSLVSLLDALTCLLPFILAAVVNTLPAQDSATTPPGPLTPLTVTNTLEKLEVVLGEKGVTGSALGLVHQYVGREWFRSWPELDFVTGRVVASVMDTLAHVEAKARGVVEAGVRLIGQLVVCLGPHLTSSAVVPAVLGRLGAAGDQEGVAAVRAGKTGLNSTLPLVYAAAVLGTGPSVELEGFLTRHITTMSQCRAPPDSLQAMVAMLLSTSRHHDTVLAAMWACVVHPAPAVRAVTADLWGTALSALPEAQVSARVLPALVTLATDPDHTVRAATLPPLATTLTTTTTPQVEDKVWLQMEMLCDDHGTADSLELQLALPHTCCLLAHTQHTRLIHHFLLPRMCRVCVSGGERVGGTLGAAMLEAYAALTSCHLPDHVVAHFVLPPLNQLQKTLGPTSFEHMETITDLIKEYNLRAQASLGLERRKSTLSLTGSLPSHPGVDDMKNKVSKMFSTTNTLHNKAQALNVNLPGFLKKK